MRRSRNHPRHVQCERTRHGRTVYYYRKGTGPRIRLDGNYLSPEFWASYAAAATGIVGPRDERLSGRFIEIRAAIRRGLQAAKYRSLKRGAPFNLTKEWALAQVEKQDFKCAMTGIPFFCKRPLDARVHPYSLSFDRIDPKNGYTIDNVRIVVFAINAMLLDWGEEIVCRVMSGYQRVRNSGS